MLDYQIKLLEARIRDISVVELFGAKTELTNEQIVLLKKQIEMLKSGYPLDYLLGEVEILGLRLRLSENLLIPRPETEEWLQELRFGNDELAKKNLLVDLGCGCGIIGLYLSQFFDQVLAVDISIHAINITRQNAKSNRIKNIGCYRSNGFSKIELKNRIEKYCNTNKTSWTLVANLPYLPIEDKKKQDEFKVKYEPDLALYSGNDGLDLFRKVLGELQRFESKPTQVIFELDPRNIRTAKDLLESTGYETNIWTDAGGFERILVGNKR